MKPLLLGEAPGPGGGTHDPLGAKTAKRLCGFAGWDAEGEGDDPYREALARRFELRNLLDYMPGKAGKGMLFPLTEAREAAKSLDLRGRVVVCLGKRVAAAVGAPRDYFVWRLADATMVVIPHPSGTNRVLNDETMRKTTGRTLRGASLMVAWTKE